MYRASRKIANQVRRYDPHLFLEWNNKGGYFDLWRHQDTGRVLITPVTRSIYSAAQQITEQIVGDQTKFFKSCVLVEYPRPGVWAIGFLTGARSPRPVF